MSFCMGRLSNDNGDTVVIHKGDGYFQITYIPGSPDKPIRDDTNLHFNHIMDDAAAFLFPDD